MIKEVTIADFTALATNPLSLLSHEIAKKSLTNVEKSDLSKKIRDFISDNYALFFESQNRKSAQVNLEKLHTFSIYQNLDSSLIDAIQQQIRWIQGPVLHFGSFRSKQHCDGLQLKWEFGYFNAEGLKRLDKIFSNTSDAPIVYLDFTEAYDMINDGDLAALMSSNPNIKGITCKSISEITIKGIKQIAKHGKNLESFSITASVINDHWLQTLAQCNKLKILHLKNCSGLTTAGLSYLPNIPLKILSLDDVSVIHDRAIAHLQQLSSLTSLSLKNLKSVYALSDSFFTEMKELNKLELVSLQISDRDLAGLESCKRLASLCLSGCSSLTEDCLSTVGKLSGITVLDISRTSAATAAGLKQLQGCKRLQELDLSYCLHFGEDPQVSPLESLHNLDSLTVLDLDGLDTIQPQDLCSLVENCKNLKGISLLEGLQPPEELIQKLTKLRPNISLDYNFETGCTLM